MHGRLIDGAKLRDIRERQGLRRADLHELSKVSISYIKYIETRNQQPSGLVAYALARALKVDISAFSTETAGDEAA